MQWVESNHTTAQKNSLKPEWALGCFWRRVWDSRTQGKAVPSPAWLFLCNTRERRPLREAVVRDAAATVLRRSRRHAVGRI